MVYQTLQKFSFCRCGQLILVISSHANLMIACLNCSNFCWVYSYFTVSSILQDAISVWYAQLNNLHSWCLVQVADSTQVVVTSSNAEAMSFVNTAFWDPSNQIAVVCSLIMYAGALIIVNACCACTISYIWVYS